jgi:alkylation response protein AidB-like acyl-CoA dehydrogenase
VDFRFSAEQEGLRSTVRRFLEEHSPEPEIRRLMATDEGYDTIVWARMAEQLGLQGLIVPEEYGGSGASWRELGIVLEEMGRSLLCAPFFSTVVLAATTILESNDAEAKHRLLPGIVDGSTVATLALHEETGGWGESGIRLEATRSEDGYALHGHKSYVLDGMVADAIIVAARTPGGVSLFVVAGDAPGLGKTPLKTLDLTRKLTRLDFTDVPGRILGAEGQGWDVLERVLDLAAVGLAAEQAGGAEAALQLAVDYAKVRVQFGQPIGSFQAIKHMCADLLLEVESAKSAAYYALWAASERTSELPAAAALAKAFCSDAFVLAAHQNIQIHGGIGFTWAMPAHLYFKRAKSMELFLGDPIYHRERLAKCIGL